MGVKSRTYAEAKALLAIIERWCSEGELSTLERNLALKKLSKIYDDILLYEQGESTTEGITTDNQSDNIEEEREIEVEVVLFEEPEPVEEPAVEVFSSKPHSARHSAILSLYDEASGAATQAVQPAKIEAQPTITPEPIQEEEVTTEGSEVVELKLEQKQREQKQQGELPLEMEIIAERLSSISSGQKSVAEEVSTLVKSISLNDKYEIAHELFNGDVEELMKLLDELDSFDSFDECVIYISENHPFEGDSNAAKMLLELLKRRFN